MDLKYIKDAAGELFVALSMVDAATCYHAAKLLRCREPNHVAGKLMTGWIAIYGVPVNLVCDQGGEFESDFIAMLEQHGIASKVTGSHAAWQHGFCERQGALLGVAWTAAVDTDHAEGRKAMKVALACALQAKNATVSRRGHSAHQLVFGRQCYMPELLDEETWGAAAVGQALSLEGEVARQSELRAAAKMALLRSDIHEKLKAALRRAPGGQVREFAPGEMVYFWSPAADVKNKRYKRNAGAWRGPAVVLMPDGQQKYFVSWRGRCLLVAAAYLKVASLEAANDHDLRLREAEAHLERGYLDLSEEAVADPRQEEESNMEPHLPALRVRRARNGLGRKLSEAQHMMRHLKSVKRMLKLPLRPQLRRRPRRVRPELPPSGADGPSQPAGGVRAEDVPVPSDIGSDYAPSESPEVERIPQEHLVPVVPAPVDAAALRRRQEMLDDLPDTRLFRKRLRDEAEDEGELELPHAKRLRDPDFGNYVLTALSEGDIFQLPVRKNEWLSKAEVCQLGKLLDLPLSSVRLHRAPRKRLQCPGVHRARPRTTVMFQKDPSNVLVGQETAEQVAQRPQRRVPFLWRGMTLFTKQRHRGRRRRVPLLTFYGYSAEGKPGPAPFFVQKDGVTYALPSVSEATFFAACADLTEATRATEAFLLRMKASGKELDPRHFDNEEAKQFEKSDLAEWEAWEKNKVVQRLSPEEARRVPEHRVFRVPARVVRTNKAALGSKLLQAKSRIVLPGHTDPDLGMVRTDSPTTQESAEVDFESGGFPKLVGFPLRRLDCLFVGQSSWKRTLRSTSS